MAASLSQPDPTSPTSIAEAGFSTSRRGFNTDEVRTFLISVAAEMGRLRERERQLQAEVSQAQAAAKEPPEIDEETVTRFVGEETTRVLQAARESATSIKQHAEDAASELLKQANDEAKRIRQDANEEAARSRQAATDEAEALVAAAKEEGREMVNEARSYRERVLADLDKRTKLAQAQVDELAQGRDRLLQVFQRARLVAVDVANELQEMDGPDEQVNLDPTTGPVPLMVPSQQQRPGDTLAEAATSPSGVDDATDTGDDAADDSTETTSDIASDEDTTDPNLAESAHDEPAADQDGIEPDGQRDDRDDSGEITAADSSAESDAADGATELEDAETSTDDLDIENEIASSAENDTKNVVDLFPGSDDADATGDDAASDNQPEQSDSGDADDAAPQDGDGNGAPSAAAGIFARLRDQVPDAATADPTSTEADDVESASDEPASEDVTEDSDEDLSPFARRDAAIAPLITTSARTMKRVLADEQNGVLTQLRTVDTVTEVDQLLVDGDDAERADRYVDAVTEQLTEAAMAGAAVVGATDSSTMRKTLVGAGALKPAIELITENLVEALRDRLERAVNDAAGDNDSITQRVRSIYREFKTQRIDDELDDIFLSAYGTGMAVAVDPGTPLKWTIDERHSSCPDCEDNSLGGFVPAGDEFPTGHTAAPAHPGCRCLTLPDGQ